MMKVVVSSLHDHLIIHRLTRNDGKVILYGGDRSISIEEETISFLAFIWLTLSYNENLLNIDHQNIRSYSKYFKTFELQLT